MMQKFLTSEKLSAIPGLTHGFTTRELGADADKIAATLNIPVSNLYSITQVHGGNVVVISDSSVRGELPEGDALITKRPGIVIGVKTADCLPILLCDPQARVVAAIHAGWRGFITDIIQNTFKTLIADFGFDPQSSFYALGPNLCLDSFEVGPEVVQQFQNRYDKSFSWVPAANGRKDHIDLVTTAKMILQDLGMPEKNGSNFDYCTLKDAEMFYSHRRQPGEGRQFSFIGWI